MTTRSVDTPPLCRHCGKEIANKGTPSMGGNHEILWMHVPGGTVCHPQQGADSTRAEPRSTRETGLRERIEDALRATARTGYPPAPVVHGAHDQDGRCALCANDVEALTNALLDVIAQQGWDDA